MQHLERNNVQVIDSIQPFRPGERASRRLPPPPGPPPSPRAVDARRVVRPVQSIDGMMPRQQPSPASVQPIVPVARPVLRVASPLPPQAAGPVVQLPPLTLEPASPLAIPKKRAIKTKAFGVLAALVFVGFIIATRQPFGQVLVMVYGIIAIKQHLSSRITFLLALGALGLALGSMVALDGQSGIPPAFASYAFLLLGVGAVALAFELRDTSSTPLAGSLQRTF
jgi:hypothetical protein